jgi:hypothetical protein
MSDIPKLKPSIPGVKSTGNSVVQPTPATQSGGSTQNKNQEEHDEMTEPEELIEENEEESFPSEAEQEEPHPRFDEVDIMFYMLLAIAGDIGDGIWVTRFFFAPTTLLFLYFKGVDTAIGKNVIAQFAELVPMFGWLPISTTAAIFTIFATNHPEKFQQWFGKAGEVIEKAGKMGKK